MPVSIKVLSSIEAPKQYKTALSDEVVYESEFSLKVDCDFQAEKLIFSLQDGKQIKLHKLKDEDPTFKTVEYKYFISDGNTFFDLQSYIKLGLFEPSGWNFF